MIRTTITAIALTAALTTAAAAHDNVNQDRAYGGIQSERTRQEALIEQGPVTARSPGRKSSA